MKPYMDFSNYPTNHELFTNENKAKLGYFKDEFCGSKRCVEFIGLRAKCYCFNLEDKKTKEVTTKKTCKGLGRTAINNRLKFDQYKKCLMEGKLKDIIFLPFVLPNINYQLSGKEKKLFRILTLNVFYLHVAFIRYLITIIKSKNSIIRVLTVNDKNVFQ